MCTCGGVPPYQIFTEKGEHSWCPCRIARIKLQATKKAFRESQIPKKYFWKFLDDFKTDVSEKAQKLSGLVDTIRDTSPEKKWKGGFYFWGQTGSGKTLLASIILQELMLKYAIGGRFVDLSRQFFQRLRDSYNITDERYGETGQILDELIKMPFLVLDDFGIQRNTEWESEMLYNLIDSRYAEEQPTIITSNLHINAYKEIAHGRIYSRLQEMGKIIHFDLPDYREKMLENIEL
jgi:DNA replication protein DnaC